MLRTCWKTDSSVLKLELVSFPYLYWMNVVEGLRDHVRVVDKYAFHILGMFFIR